MKFTILLSAMISLMSCSSSKHHPAEYENVPHEHLSGQTQVAYEGKCATGVLNKHCNIRANKDIYYDYRKVRYFFSTEEAKQQFVRNIDANIMKADGIWEKEIESHKNL